MAVVRFVQPNPTVKQDLDLAYTSLFLTLEFVFVESMQIIATNMTKLSHLTFAKRYSGEKNLNELALLSKLTNLTELHIGSFVPKGGSAQMIPLLVTLPKLTVFEGLLNEAVTLDDVKTNCPNLNFIVYRDETIPRSIIVTK